LILIRTRKSDRLLGLNISSTRQILLNAHAGQIIEAFGKMVVGGNLIVGAILFLIITIVQFLVVTKGAERVAEVGARFTLDALPGKQMSIDADVRAGVLDNESAKVKRRHLEQESQMHGAMDGAMKFVKGDAIAALIITAINVLGGVALGIMQKGMPAAKALKVYSVLSVGDGLVSQIPALLIAITAGIIVTRVGSRRARRTLATRSSDSLPANPPAYWWEGSWCSCSPSSPESRPSPSSCWVRPPAFWDTARCPNNARFGWTTAGDRSPTRPWSRVCCLRPFLC
jgi:type III secretion protein V